MDDNDAPETEQALHFAGTADDGEHLVLTDEADARYSVAISPALRAAVRESGSGEANAPTSNASIVHPPPPSTPEAPMDPVLRPRDIQARIRAGESPEVVAQAAQTTVDRIMPYAAPVLAEREHTAQRALGASIRRAAGDTGSSARVLGEAVTAVLLRENTPSEALEWDSWRREDGRWVVLAACEVGGAMRTAQFVFDVRGNFVTLDNDDAHWLIGDQPSGPGAVEQPAEPLGRRLSAVPSAAPPADVPPGLGDDAIEMVSRPAEEPAGNVEPDPIDQPALDFDGEPEDDHGPDSADAEPDAEPTTEPQKRPVTKKKGRASVPSWDEIMFGGGDNA